ncbi:hypothetical protein V1477_002361 [Vespula maculifrons]|nr:hypothetical protein HZH66_013557 [Vespula vulgaris]KAF7398161.1 hypothetical protein H0235_016169 [Vespula pensylvanica]
MIARESADLCPPSRPSSTDSGAIDQRNFYQSLIEVIETFASDPADGFVAFGEIKSLPSVFLNFTYDEEDGCCPARNEKNRGGCL